VTIFLGAVAGALLLRIHVAVPMTFAAVLMASAALVGLRNAPASHRSGTQPCVTSLDVHNALNSAIHLC
jgi:anti-sigma-K factor RskA